MLGSVFVDLGIALGLGLLVGLQKERAESPLAGLRTFALVTLAGAVAALVSAATTPWVIVADTCRMNIRSPLPDVRSRAG